MKKTVDVIIPVYKPDEKLGKILNRLSRQSYPIGKIILMNTEEEYWKAEYTENFSNVEVHHLTKAEFDHGATRAAAATLSQADAMIFMTQDAVPYDVKVVEKLMDSLEGEGVKAVYARQLPTYDCSILERYTRSFNYPDHSREKSIKDLPELGIKTYFCSNVCAAYDKQTYNDLGGFVRKTIFNEDMIYAASVIQAGYKIAYCADACVIHSHNYNCRQQFHRNFDLGVSQAEHPEVFRDLPAAEGEGGRLVKKTARYVLSIHRPGLLVPLFFQSAFKYMGFLMGRHFKKLPRRMILHCTMNRDYWTIKA